MTDYQKTLANPWFILASVVFLTALIILVMPRTRCEIVQGGDWVRWTDVTTHEVSSYCR